MRHFALTPPLPQEREKTAPAPGKINNSELPRNAAHNAAFCTEVAVRERVTGRDVASVRQVIDVQLRAHAREPHF